MLSNQFKKQYIDLNNRGLSLTEKAYMTEIYDRMESSQKRDEFFDAENNDYYVIYTVEEMSQALEVGISTVKRTTKKLINKNWIHIKRVKNRCNLIFICDDKKISDKTDQNDHFQNGSSKMNYDNSSNWSPNQTNNKQTNNILDTCQIQAKKDIEIQKDLKTKSDDANKTRLNGLKYNLIHNICIPEEAVNSLFEVSEFQEKQVREYLDMLLTAKRIAVKKAHKELYFEKSGEIQGTLADRIKYVFQKAKEVAKNKMSYIKQSFINYFYEILCPEKIAQPVKAARTYTKKNRIVEKLPDWAIKQQNGESLTPDEPEQDKTEINNEIQNLLAKINQSAPIMA